MRAGVLAAAVLAAWLAAVLLDLRGAPCADPEAILSFGRDIRPILSDKCFPCHGPDAESRQAELRLDLRADAVADRGGHAAIAPGNVLASRLIARVTASDPDQRMPPDGKKQLTAREIELLGNWIRQGAAYSRHWSLEVPVKPVVPVVPRAKQPKNPIDAFVEDRLREHGLTLAGEAQSDTLLRRVTLDLTGLPPTLAELQAFRESLREPGADPEACYERVVDRLLGSKHFGEHLAVAWLDAARYADTNGYFGDKPRQMWLWRDWVINALNANMPYDQFTIEQLAGDLLPDATLQQRIATGFNRNHMANNETGIIDEEFRTEYVVDRVHTTMTTWLGLTAQCAQCHDHKFDPISQREFYQLFAFFNNVPENGLITQDDPPPRIEVPSVRQTRRLAELQAASREAMDAFEPVRKQLLAAITSWEADAPSILAKPPSNSVVFHESFDGGVNQDVSSAGTALQFVPGLLGQSVSFDATRHVEVELRDFQADGPWTIGFWMMPDGSLSCPVSLIEPTGNRRGIEVLLAKGLLKVHLVDCWGVSQIEVSTTRPMTARNWHHVVVCYDGSRKAKGLHVFVDGEREEIAVRRDTLDGSLANAEPLRIGRRDSGLGFYGRIDEVRIVADKMNGKAVRDWFWSERIRSILAVAADKRSAADVEALLDFQLERFGTPSERAARQRVTAARQAERKLRDAVPTALVMQELKTPRTTHVLQRGQYDKPLAPVLPDVPASIAPWPDGAPRNRLGLARWIVAPQNPLTARVAVNRFWQQCFGEGLVRTVDDFGSQGEPPTHPELLDWLAVTFRESGWNIKQLLRQIVTSRTYRQRSQFTTPVAQTEWSDHGGAFKDLESINAPAVFDPENRLLARGPSGRLSAEMLRDQALAVSGLLVPAIGGPSVKPYQPPGLWEAVSYNGEESYLADTGSGLWRRSLYTYLKRQSPPPSLLTFDGPTREKCSIRRAPTNTPLQALLLLNDETFLEASRKLASRALASRPGSGHPTDAWRLQFVWRAILSREAHDEELELLDGLLNRQRSRFVAHPDAAQRLLAIGASSLDPISDPGELAAWTVVVHSVFNLDEAITKR